MSLTGKKLKDAYKDILQMDNSNSGVGTSTAVVKDGDGNLSSLYIGDDNVKIQPENDNTSTTFVVANQSGTNVLAVDTTNKECSVNGHYVNTQYKNFGVFDISPVAGTHYPLVAMTGMYSLSGATYTPISFGTGTDPATSATISNVSYTYNPIYRYLHSNITIDAIFVMASANGSTTANFHLFSYDVVTGSGSTAGNLSNGTLLAHNGSALTLGDDRVSTTTMTIDSADVAASKVILAFVENIGGTDDVTVQMEVKYHLNA